MPTAKPLFQGTKPAEKIAASPAQQPVAPQTEPKKAPPAPKHPIALAITDTTDDRWNRGILRKGSADRLATILVIATPATVLLQTGTAVRFASGSLRRITHIEPKANHIEIGLDGPLDPYLDGGRRAETLDDISVATGKDQFVLSDWTDNNWLRGVWNLRDQHHRRSFFVRRDAPGMPRLRVGMLLAFAASGIRRITETRIDGANLRVFLDNEIRPFGDGAPNVVRVLSPMTSFEESATLSLAENPNAESTAGGSRNAGAENGRMIHLANSGAIARVRRGTVLRFASGTLRNVIQVVTKHSHSEVLLDRSIDLKRDTASTALSIAGPRRLVDGVPVDYVYKVPEFPRSSALYQVLIDEARKRARALPAPAYEKQQGTPARLITLIGYAPTGQSRQSGCYS